MIQPDIIATIKFYPTNEGGRKMPIVHSIFKCPFKFNDNLYDCALLLENIGHIIPGETKIVPIKFLNPGLIKSKLVESSTFFLWDGRDIASGIVNVVYSA